MTMWYVNRAAGLVSWALLCGSMILGLLLSSKVLGRRLKANWLQDLHRGLSGLAVIFVAVHVAGAIGDNFIHFGAAEVLVPLASEWRPWAVAWGVVTMYLLIAVEGSSLLRKHLPKTVWRRFHFLSFPLFVTATAHGIMAGSEMGATAGIAVAAVMAATIAGLTAMRVVEAMEKSKQVAATTPTPGPPPTGPPTGPPSYAPPPRPGSPF